MTRTPDYERDGIQLFCRDCLEILPELSGIDAVVTDPPYLTDDTQVILSKAGSKSGVAKATVDSRAIGNPWGYSLDWMDFIPPVQHWVVYANYRMLGGLCTRIEEFGKLSTVFTWMKTNAPRMTRPVPRLDCEFIIWARTKSATCERMGEFDSMVLDVPMLQAGCFATERILKTESGAAVHPCQKPLAVVRPFIDRLNARTVLDPFMGTGTTGVACIEHGRNFIGIEKDPTYFAIAVKRIEAALNTDRDSLWTAKQLAKETQRELL